jgi:uncharacterized membrane protein
MMSSRVHAFTWMATALGVAMLWRAGHLGGDARSPRWLVGAACVRRPVEVEAQ